MHDVTQKILDIHRIYGSSDNTAPAGLSSSKSLNYANGASIQKPEVSKLTTIPYTFNWQDSIGLFGVENHFVKIDMKIIDQGNNTIIVGVYEDPRITPGPGVEVNTFQAAVIDENRDLTVVNTYEPATIEYGGLPRYASPRVSVELINNKTGNKYTDRDLDVRLYTKDKQEWAYDKMYLPSDDFFYIGFHARNTRRLPYNVSCRIGEEYLNLYTLTPEQNKLTPSLL